MTPQRISGTTHVFHQYVIRDSARDALQVALQQRGINTAIHYALPVHLQTAYRDRLPQLVDLSQTEGVVRDILSLPIYPQLADEAVDRIGSAVCELRPRIQDV